MATNVKGTVEVAGPGTCLKDLEKEVMKLNIEKHTVNIKKCNAKQINWDSYLQLLL